MDGSATGLDAEASQAAGEAAAPNGDGRPDWLPAKFWDGEAKSARYEDMAKSYANLESTFGKRINELPEPARRALIEAVPDAVREEWSKAERERLAADDEFLSPILEARKPVAPEAYELKRDALPEALELADDDPLLTAVQGWAKTAGLSQEHFDGLISAYGEVVKAQMEAQPDIEEVRRQIGPDFERRSKAIATKLVSVAGAESAKALLDAIQTPEQFAAVEKLVKSGQDPALPAPTSAATPSQTREQLEHMMQDPRYHDPRQRDPAFVKQVTDGFQALYGGTAA